MNILLGASGSGSPSCSAHSRPASTRLRSDPVNGQRVDDMASAISLRLRAASASLFQENALFDSLTVAENVGYRFMRRNRHPEDQVRIRVEEVLGFMGLREFIDRMPQLSGGQRKRVAIARAIAAKPHLLLFDDPTTGLDPSLPQRLMTKSLSCATWNT